MVDSSPSRRPPSPEDPAPQIDRLAESTCSLLTRAKGGDTTALGEICARFLPRLSRWAEGRLPLRARGMVDTSDLVQESLVNAIGCLGNIQARYPGRRPEVTALDGTELDPSASPLEEALGRELAEQYEVALSLLRDADRAILFLKIEMNLSHREIADALDKPSVDAARMAINRAMIRLAEEMHVESG